MAQPRSRAEQALSGPSTVNAALAPVPPDAAAAAPTLDPKTPIATTQDGRVVLARPGGLVSVAPADVQRALTEPSTRLATPEEWDKHQVAKDTSAAEEFVKEAGASFVSHSVRLPAMVADLADPGSASDFLRETSPAGVRASFGALWDSAFNDQKITDAYDETKRRQAIYEELFPTARALGRVGGEIATSVAQGAALGVPGFLGRAPTAASAAMRGALVDATEGAASAMAEEYRQSYLENRAVDREHLVNSGLVGAVLGGGVGAVAGYGGKKVGDYLEGRAAKAAAPDARADRVAATERAVAESVDELDRPAAELEQELTAAQARVAEAAAKAGPNPNAQQVAAEAAADAEMAEIRKAAGAEFDPKRWREMADGRASSMTSFLHRDAGLEGATQELRQHGDEMLKGTRDLLPILKDAGLKREQVAAKLAADGVDETTAIAAAQNAQREFGASFAQARQALIDEGLQGSKARVYLDRLNKVNVQAEKVLGKVDNAADAYIARDQFRRGVLQIKNQLDDYAMKGAPDPNDLMATRLLQPIVDAEYHKAANSLFDTGVWKSMGEFQQAVNGQDGWVGLIKADRIGLKDFASVVDLGDGRGYSAEVLGFDPDKVKRYLSSIDQDTLRDAQIRNIIGKRAMMVRTMRDGLELTPAQKATADRVLAASEKALSTLDDAEKMAIRVNKQARLNESDKLLAQGGLVTKILSGGLKLVSGDVRGAASQFMGGPEQVARMAQAVKVQAEAGESRLVRGILKIVQKVSGEESPNVPALEKISKRAKAAGIINDQAEKLARRMQRYSYAAPPLFGPYAHEATLAEKRDAHARRQDVLAELVANPESMQQGMDQALGRVTAASPNMAASVGDQITARVQRLQAAWPGERAASLLPNAPKSKVNMVSEQDLKKADALLQATLDPQSVFDDFLRGTLDYDKLRFAKEQSPALFEQAKAFALDLFRDLPADLQPNMATQLDFLLGFEGQLDPTLSEDFLKRQRARLEEQRGKAQANAAPRRAPSLGKSMVTYTQRLGGA